MQSQSLFSPFVLTVQVSRGHMVPVQVAWGFFT